MSCPNCSHTLQLIVHETDDQCAVFWCRRCGTLRIQPSIGPAEDSAPAIVVRCRAYAGTARLDVALWHSLGIDESIKPEANPDAGPAVLAEAAAVVPEPERPAPVNPIIVRAAPFTLEAASVEAKRLSAELDAINARKADLDARLAGCQDHRDATWSMYDGLCRYLEANGIPRGSLGEVEIPF